MQRGLKGMLGADVRQAPACSSPLCMRKYAGVCLLACGPQPLNPYRHAWCICTGEYVAVEKVEAVYKKNLVTEQVWV